MGRRVVVGAVLGLVSCTNLETYVLEGRFYDQDRDCLETELVIDVIEGKTSGTCDGVKCIQSQETGDYYVTAICTVPPLYDDLTDATDGPCADALAAYARDGDTSCPGGGGSGGGN